MSLTPQKLRAQSAVPASRQAQQALRAKQLSASPQHSSVAATSSAEFTASLRGSNPSRPPTRAAPQTAARRALSATTRQGAAQADRSAAKPLVLLGDDPVKNADLLGIKDYVDTDESDERHSNSTREPVRVAVRARPMNSRRSFNAKNGAALSASSLNGASCLTFHHSVRQVQVGQVRAFTFDYTFDQSATQAQVYNECVARLVAAFMKGHNATIFAYGQTGTGKTHSMGTGQMLSTTLDAFGIVQRLLTHLWKLITQLPSGADHSLRCSYLELYDEKLFDLLALPASDDRPQRRLDLREDTAGRVIVSGLNETKINSYAEAMALLQRGTLQRSTSATAMNQVSSRSHSVYTIHLEYYNPETMQRTMSKFHLCDLAGSERQTIFSPSLQSNGKGQQQQDRESSGQALGDGAKNQRFAESISINKGLLALANCISILSDDKRKHGHVPFRDSKLTRLLQDSLGGNSNTLMLATISSDEKNLNETISSLKYAQNARNIVNAIVPQTTLPNGQPIQQVQIITQTVQDESVQALLAEKDAAIVDMRQQVDQMRDELMQWQAQRGSTARVVHSPQQEANDEMAAQNETNIALLAVAEQHTATARSQSDALAQALSHLMSELRISMQVDAVRDTQRLRVIELKKQTEFASHPSQAGIASQQAIESLQQQTLDQQRDYVDKRDASLEQRQYVERLMQEYTQLVGDYRKDSGGGDVPPLPIKPKAEQSWSEAHSRNTSPKHQKHQQQQSQPSQQSQQQPQQSQQPEQQQQQQSDRQEVDASLSKLQSELTSRFQSQLKAAQSKHEDDTEAMTVVVAKSLADVRQAKAAQQDAQQSRQVALDQLSELRQSIQQNQALLDDAVARESSLQLALERQQQHAQQELRDAQRLAQQQVVALQTQLTQLRQQAAHYQQLCLQLVHVKPKTPAAAANDKTEAKNGANKTTQQRLIAQYTALEARVATLQQQRNKLLAQQKELKSQCRSLASEAASNLASMQQELDKLKSQLSSKQMTLQLMQTEAHLKPQQAPVVDKQARIVELQSQLADIKLSLQQRGMGALNRVAIQSKQDELRQEVARLQAPPPDEAAAQLLNNSATPAAPTQPSGPDPAQLAAVAAAQQEVEKLRSDVASLQSRITLSDVGSSRQIASLQQAQQENRSQLTEVRVQLRIAESQLDAAKSTLGSSVQDQSSIDDQHTAAALSQPAPSVDSAASVRPSTASSLIASAQWLEEQIDLFLNQKSLHSQLLSAIDDKAQLEQQRRTYNELRRQLESRLEQQKAQLEAAQLSSHDQRPMTSRPGRRSSLHPINASASRELVMQTEEQIRLLDQRLRDKQQQYDRALHSKLADSTSSDAAVAAAALVVSPSNELVQIKQQVDQMKAQKSQLQQQTEEVQSELALHRASVRAQADEAAMQSAEQRLASLQDRIDSCDIEIEYKSQRIGEMQNIQSEQPLKGDAAANEAKSTPADGTIPVPQPQSVASLQADFVARVVRATTQEDSLAAQEELNDVVRRYVEISIEFKQSQVTAQAEIERLESQLRDASQESQLLQQALRAQVKQSEQRIEMIKIDYQQQLARLQQQSSRPQTAQLLTSRLAS